MARLDIQIFADASGVTKGMTQATNAIRGFESSLNKSTKSSEKALTSLNAKVGQSVSQFKLLSSTPFNFGDRAAAQANKVVPATEAMGNGFNQFKTGVGASNAVAQEFSRIVQDMPFGMIGIGNNIQQLTQNFATLRSQMAATSGQAVSMGAAMKASFAAMMSPMNLLVLGVAAITSAYTWWIMSQRGGNKTTKDTQQTFEEFTRTLEEVRGALLRGSSAAQDETVELDSLYRVSQDVTQSTKNRLSAINALQDQFPAYFKNLTDEQILNGGGAESYERLSVALVAMAQARAIQNELAANSIELLRKESQMQDLVAKKIKAVEKAKTAGDDISSTTSYSPTSVMSWGNSRLADRAIENIDSEMNALAGTIYTINNDTLDLKKSFDDIFKDGKADINEFVNGFTQASGKVKEVSTGLAQLMDMRDKLEKSIEMAVDDKQVKALSKRLLDINLQIERLTSKYHDIKLRIAADFFGRPEFDVNVNNVQDSGNRDNIGEWASKEFKSAIDERNKYEKKTSSKWLEEKAKLDTKYVTDKFKKADGKDFTRGFERAVESSFKDIYKTVSTLGQEGRDIYESYAAEIDKATGANKAFLISIRDQRVAIANSVGGIVGDIIGSLNQSTNQTMQGVMADQLKSVFKDAKIGLDTSAGKFAMAASMIGNVLGGVFKKTSTGGQALSGGLQGAASGAMMGSVIPGIGTAVGAVVGGVLGAVGGIFGASKAKKEQRIQEQQLEESRRQTKLMERQNALAYAGNVIGRMVEGVGIITGLDIDSTGNLVAKVEGNDIYFIYNRVAKEKGRGL